MGISITNKEKILKGFKDGKGIAIAFMPFGFAVGLITSSYGVNSLLGGFMSFFVYSGASQILLLKIFSSGDFDILSTIIAASLLNFRYVLINLSMYKTIESKNRFLKFITGIMFTDETVAYLALAKNTDIYYALGINLIGYISFGLSTVLGIALGKYIPILVINSMKFLLYGTFLSLLVTSLMISSNNLKIILITIILKLLCIYTPLRNLSQSIQIVFILSFTSLIYSYISLRSDKR